MSLVDPLHDPNANSNAISMAREGSDGGHSSIPIALTLTEPPLAHRQAPTSAEIDAVIAAAMANAPPAPPSLEVGRDASVRSLTPLMTNILPSAIGSDGRVNLFVGNLPYRVRWQDLKDLFRKAGTVLRADVSLGPDNRSRGYGNVLMGSREDAARAIDRFNGFTWQTRTLEVRPDRLPPEYEPQPHMHHKPMYGFIPPMPHFNGGSWPPQQRPPPGPQYPSYPLHLGPPPLSHGSSPAPPQLPYTGAPPPMPSHSAPVGALGASPLAGSLTSGANNVPNWISAARRDSLASYGGISSPDASALPLPRSASPASLAAQASRTGSHESSGKQPSSPVKLPELEHPTRAPPPGSLGPLPPSMFAGVKAVISPDMEPAILRRTSASSEATLNLPAPIALNGLASQAKDLGAPSTLIDRVVFVQNLPLTMHWQDLKDLFRPAGVVIRADVATGPDGRPRGFGTVLFASKDDTFKAVSMFNNLEIDGRNLRVQTERQSLEDNHIQPIHPVDTLPAFGTSSPRWSQPSLPQLNHASSDPFPATVTAASPRIPWQLNTTVDEGAERMRFEPPIDTPPQHNGHGHGNSTRQPRHPGPINLPPFPELGEINPISPLQTRGLPPMTPSMPGFVFNAHPQTPPLHPQFLSPGAGPFSPGQPVTSPMFSFTPFLNAAPGAPVNRPSVHQGGSAALGTPTTQAFPNVPHATAGPPGSRFSEEYFPRVDTPPSRLSSAAASPLNARERLASTRNNDDVALAARTNTLSLDESPMNSARSSPTPAYSHRMLHKRSVSGSDRALAAHYENAVGGAETPLSVNSRSSLDAQRTLGLGAWNADRRASWSDLAGVVQNIKDE